MAFQQSSLNVDLEDGEYGKPLVAMCRNRKGQYVPLQLSLDLLLGNNDGTFQWGWTDWSTTAEHPTVNSIGTLAAKLQNIDGKWVPAEIHLGDHIANIDGVLTAVNMPTE